jgi:glycosyltransferase involved in cell wall biosynthesis
MKHFYEEKNVKVAAYCIAKNEGPNLAITLDSVKQIASEIVVVDTGSVDNTLEVAKRYTNKVFVHPQSEEWTADPAAFDFSAARNFALDKLDELQNIDWILSVDCDEVLAPETAANLKGRLKGLPDTVTLVLVTIEMREDDGTPFQRFMAERLIRAGSGLRFEGKMHNWVNAPVDESRLALPDLEIWHNRAPRDPVFRTERCEQRVAMAERYFKPLIEVNPTDRRSLFYLAGTYYDAGRMDETIEWYEKYLPVSDWPEERYQAGLVLARAYLTRGDKENAKRVLGGALKDNWQRNEAYLLLGDIALADGKDAEAEWWYKAASLKPLSPDPLFVEVPEHTWVPHQKLFELYKNHNDAQSALAHGNLAIQAGSPHLPEVLKYTKNHTEYRDSRILALVDRGQMDFIQSVLEDWDSQGKTVTVASEWNDEAKKVDADLIWCEWCGAEAVKMSHEIEKKARIVVHVLGYELNTTYLADMNWGVVDDVIFISDGLRQSVLERYPVIEVCCNVYVVPGGVELDKFDIAPPAEPVDETPCEGKFLTVTDPKLEGQEYGTLLLDHTGEVLWQRPYEYKWILDRMIPGESVLDLGAGRSLFAEQIAKCGCEVVRSDVDKGAMAWQAEQNPEIRCITGSDIGSLAYDAVVACSVLEHEKNVNQLIGQIAKATKPGGRLIATFDVPRITPRELRGALEAAGFAVPEMSEAIPDGAIGGRRAKGRWIPDTENPQLRVYAVVAVKRAIGKSGKKIAMLGYVHARKNIPLALQILAKCPKDYELHIGGEWQDDELMAYFRNLRKELGLEGRVTIHGRIEDKDAFFADKDFVLSTSVRETFHYAVAEGMAAGLKPVIHSWASAREVYEDKWIFNTVDEAVEMLTSPCDPAEYRAYASRYLNSGLRLKRITRILKRPRIAVAGQPRYADAFEHKIINGFDTIGCNTEGPFPEMVFIMGRNYKLQPWMKDLLKVLWVEDSHLEDYADMIPEVDVVIAQTELFVDRLKAMGAKKVIKYTMVLGAQPPFCKLDCDKKYDVGFYGYMMERRGPILEALGKEVDVTILDLEFDHTILNQFINQCKIIVNVHAYEQPYQTILPRPTECMAAGTFVISEPLPPDHPFPKKYGSCDEPYSIENVKKYLADDELRERLAAEAHSYVWRHLTLRQQLEGLLDALGL